METIKDQQSGNRAAAAAGAAAYGASLRVDETARSDCPVCGRAGTFTVTRKRDGIVWYCYSASCGTRGGSREFIPGEGSRPAPPPMYQVPMHPLDEVERQYFWDRFDVRGTEWTG